MEVNDFIGTEKLKSGSGIELASGSIISGGAYMPIMLRVEDYDIKDWSPVFTPALVKSFNMAIGYKATIPADLTNTIAIGTSIVPTTSNVVQLGAWSQQVLTVKEPAYRLDERDMADVADSVIGLNFIDTLKPIKYRAMYRDSNLDEKFPLPHPINEPEVPIRDIYRIQQPDGSFTIDEKSYGDAVAEYTKKNEAFLTYRSTLEKVLEDRKNAYTETGSVKDATYSYAFKPSEFKSNEDADFNPMFGNLNSDVAVHYRPTQLIVPIVKAIQEEHTLIKDLRTDTDDQYTRLDKLDQELVGVNNKLVEVNNKLVEVDNELSDVNNKLVEVDNELSDVNNKLVEVDNELSDVNNKLVEVDAVVAGIQGDADAAKKAAEDAQAANADKLTDINKRIEDLAAGEGSARNIDVDYGYSYRVGSVDGTTSYSVVKMGAGGSLVVGDVNQNMTLRGGIIGIVSPKAEIASPIFEIRSTSVDIYTTNRLVLWAGAGAIRWSGSEFSPFNSKFDDTHGITLGSDGLEGALRWDSIYLMKDPNISSDARLKKDKRPLEEREKAAALEIKASIGIYKLIRSIARKGDNARLHVGVYAQEIVAIMERHGLSPLDYSFIGIDKSDSQYYNIRYGELTLFILAAL